MIRPFKKTDIGAVNEWLMAHGDKPVARENLPSVGFIAPGVAAGFLLQTDTPLCFLESFVTNPKVDREIRHEALEEIIFTLFAAARELGFEKVLAATKDGGIKSRAEKWEFEPLGNYAFFAKEIQ